MWQRLYLCNCACIVKYSCNLFAGNCNRNEASLVTLQDINIEKAVYVLPELHVSRSNCRVVALAAWFTVVV